MFEIDVGGFYLKGTRQRLSIPGDIRSKQSMHFISKSNWVQQRQSASPIDCSVYMTAYGRYVSMHEYEWVRCTVRCDYVCHTAATCDLLWSHAFRTVSFRLYTEANKTTADVLLKCHESMTRCIWEIKRQIIYYILIYTPLLRDVFFFFTPTLPPLSRRFDAHPTVHAPTQPSPSCPLFERQSSRDHLGTIIRRDPLIVSATKDPHGNQLTWYYLIRTMGWR